MPWSAQREKDSSISLSPAVTGLLLLLTLTSMSLAWSGVIGIARAEASDPARSMQLKSPESFAQVNDAGYKPQIPTPSGDNARAAASTYAHQGTFKDRKGSRVNIVSNYDVDMKMIADTIEKSLHPKAGPLAILVVSYLKGEVRKKCGAPAEVDIKGCYTNTTKTKGAMVIGFDDPNLQQTLLHEYGHHVDQQLYNLEEVAKCKGNGDGSRRWLIARKLNKEILANGWSCKYEKGYINAIGEIFANDFAQLNGVDKWEYLLFPFQEPPTKRVLAALKRDIKKPFKPKDLAWLRGRFNKSGKRDFRFRVQIPSFVDADAKGSVRRMKLMKGKKVLDQESKYVVNLLQKGRNYKVRIYGKPGKKYDVMIGRF